MTLKQPKAVIAALAVIAVIVAATFAEAGGRLALGALVGVLAGFSLYHASFGFTAGWRRFIRERRGGGLRAQLWLVGATAVFAIPLIHYGGLIGVQTGGFVFPFGIAVIIGSFAFGLGMQLGGGCGSGTLFTVGGGSTRMVITLAFFILGGLLATHNWDFWQSLPALGAVTFAAPLGPIGAVLATVVALGLIGLLTVRAEKARHGNLLGGTAMGSLVTGPWSLAAGTVGLTLVGVLTLLVLGRPWGITSGLTLWGAQIANVVGVPVGEWDYWRYAMNRVEGSIFSDGVSVMNLGLIAGAALAACLAGKYAPKFNLSVRDVATAMIGGLLMGYGARIAFGCNIGALLSGIASGSLHGWGWFAFAFMGSIVGVRIRERIGMDPALSTPASARPLRTQS
ncbi:YeeE/YedE family protein [Acuticoccus sp. MNP-M23]|uniref:YeeE/YedE family protein n=1 Tax=Acuticoccus sp. MNP-M23 TaxID=3072793 RepID=UPI0028151B41|nr:YeeE/YedE family protein [Acuticoccus sp. MNP-M23]WMS41021.1 YeeE/YedE family protein [Acuticoccus sp. MNP-M23]